MAEENVPPNNSNGDEQTPTEPKDIARKYGALPGE